ncbi:hypothetical protein Hrd1104_04085 [Halorhabdus sp. CBA1104]|uniref:hypothetical protein n=1 Tax=unclassified Halorhabdus TaxID=2621901 RepID=UPI0012B2DE22|nr:MULTISPECIES: hypothetical protein [unclassified Halorhabdus]QGN06557.1 hypothetical protein Hrd1104_04085 [Halorhabdus sp. CBA1104]
MQSDVAFALQEIAGNPNLTFIYFIGFVLIGVLGVRFCVYALWNRRASDLPSQASIWTYLGFVGGAAAIYGIVGIAEIVLSGIPSVRDGVFLGFVLLLALTMQLIARQGTVADSDRGTAGSVVPSPLVAVFSLTVVGAIAAEAIGIAEQPVLALEGVGAIAFGTYGYWHGRTQLSRSMVQGTMLDTLLRHLLPVLAFSAFVPAIALVTLLGIEQIIVLHVQVVFIIMAATALMTANIKLRQNLARL